MKIEVGTADQFAGKLTFENLVEALDKAKYEYQLDYRAQYNHSFYYVSSFLKEHFEFHAKYLNWHA